MGDPKMQLSQLKLAEDYDKIAGLTEERVRAWSEGGEESF